MVTTWTEFTGNHPVGAPAEHNAAVRTRLTILACSLLIAGCSSTVTGTAVPAPPRPLKPSIMTVAVGDWVDTGQALRFVVEKIEVDPKCTAEKPLPLGRNRHLVVLTVAVETGARFVKRSDTPVWDTFLTYGPYGFDTIVSSAGPRCFPQEQSIYWSDPKPNGKYRGKVVVETYSTEGLVVHKDWKWAYPS